MSGIWRTWNQGTSYPMINNLSVGVKMKPEDCEGCQLLLPPIHMVSGRGGCYKVPMCGWQSKPISLVRDCPGPW